MTDRDQGSAATAMSPPEGDGFTERRHNETPLARVQHVLHAQPTLGPLAVLAIAIVSFSLLNDRFLQPANLSLVLQQVTVHRSAGSRPDTDHPHRRHRPVRRGNRRAGGDGHGQAVG